MHIIKQEDDLPSDIHGQNKLSSDINHMIVQNVFYPKVLAESKSPPPPKMGFKLVTFLPYIWQLLILFKNNYNWNRKQF